MSKLPSIIVPARMASTRFPEKLLHLVQGKPIILWTAERIRSEAPEYPLYFAVDHPALAECLEKAGFHSIMTRADHTCGTDRVAEANAIIGAPSVINVQGDEPLVKGEQIRALADGLKTDAAIATLAVPFREPEAFANPNQVKVVCDRAGYALYFTRSPVPFMRSAGGQVDANWLHSNTCLRHLGLYAYRADFLSRFSSLQPGFLETVEQLEQLRALEHGFRIHVGLTDQPTIGIDTPDDALAFAASLSA